MNVGRYARFGAISTVTADDADYLTHPAVFRLDGEATRVGNAPSPCGLLTPDDIGQWVEIVFHSGNCFAGTLRAYTDACCHLTGSDGRQKRVLLDGVNGVLIGEPEESGED